MLQLQSMGQKCVCVWLFGGLFMAPSRALVLTPAPHLVRLANLLEHFLSAGLLVHILRQTGACKAEG